MIKLSTYYYYLIPTILFFFLFTACDSSNLGGDLPEINSFEVEFTETDGADSRNHTHTGGVEEGEVSEYIQAINDGLLERGITEFQVLKAETFTVVEDGSFQAGQTLFANDRAKLLASQWVPNDARRNADGNNLTYLNFTPYMVANGTINAEPSIDSSFETWNNLQKNSGPDLVKIDWDGATNPSAIVNVGLPFGDIFEGDIVTMGFLPGFIFDAILGPGASGGVLGVAFTFTWLDADGNATNEVALKEIWYNDAFAWSTDGTPGTIDIESVALHENGHALGFDHFGRIAIVNANGRLNVSPRAVMNAAYIQPQRELLGTDKASYNQVYGSWPKD
ncbi:MAG: hypothetical protein JJU37_04985 [Balneolaceae bacterium]|nr:hypothetical protein [Balneolaceae bacterium]